MVEICKVVSEKIWFEFLYVHDLGPRSSNDLDLQYSHTFITSIRCLLLPTFRSLAAIVLKHPLFSLFPIEKPMLPNLTLPQNRPRSLQGHNFNIYDGLESLMLHTKIRENQPAGSGKEDFRRVFTIPASCDQIFISLFLKACVQYRVQIGTVVSEKIWFEFLYVHDFEPR